MDVLEDVLSVTHVGTHVLGVVEFVPPWGILVDTHEKAIIHIMRKGECWLRVENEPDPVRVRTGDVVLLVKRGRHALASDLHAKLEPCEQAVARAHGVVVQPLDRSASTAARENTVIQCAGYTFAQEQRTHPLLALLPSIVHVPSERANADPALQSLLNLLLLEGQSVEAGTELVAPRLIDALLVYVLRVWLRDEPQTPFGGLAALRDSQVRKALGMIHQSPQTPWTVERLARAVAMSRAAFARRFNELVGEPPLSYVTRWRMDLAAKLLRDSRESISSIARRVGYESETAFAKAFRRERSVSPAEYRLRLRTQRSPSSTAVLAS